jgi:hypothetical protein
MHHGPGTSSVIPDTSRSTINKEEQRHSGAWDWLWPHQMFWPGCFHVACWSTLEVASYSSPEHSLVHWGGCVSLFSVILCSYTHLSSGTLLTPKPETPIFRDQCPFIYDLTREQNRPLCFNTRRASWFPANPMHVKPGSPTGPQCWMLGMAIGSLLKGPSPEMRCLQFGFLSSGFPSP